MKKSRHTLVSGIFALRQYLLDHVPYKAIFFVTGVLATIWFLLRVIPKPSRAAYPCMQAAAPIMSGFVLYLISFTGSFFAFKKANSLIRGKKYTPAVVLLAIALIMGASFFVFTNLQPDARASITIMNTPPEGVNSPMGTGLGIFPGRVIWAWNPDATNQDCTNVPGDAFWDYHNNDTLVIRNMVDHSILLLTGGEDYSSAWDSIFTHHNRKKNQLNRGYEAGEKIFIKINQGTSRWALNSAEKANGYAWPKSGGIDAIVDPTWRRKNFGATETGPFVVLNILRHLVYEAGVAQQDISIGDPMSHTFKHNYQVWHDEFPNINYTDKFSSDHNRTKISSANDNSMTYSEKGAVMKDAITESYFDKMVEADYLINVACLKPHKNAGVSLCAKNHFGSITRSGAGHLHPSLISTIDQGRQPSNEGYDKYRVAVDIMGHKYLGANTMLFIVEGLFGGSEDEVWGPVQYHMNPFNGDWSNSVFMSLDQVALESVAYDFLRTEFDGTRNPGLTNIYPDWPNWLGADAYLHHAADKDQWPSGIVYNPDGSGPLSSLGVHEHWNNADDKKYSQNLGLGTGIELVQTDGDTQITAINELSPGSTLKLRVFPNPMQSQSTVSFFMDTPENISIRLFDLQGKLAADIYSGLLTQGTHNIPWSAQDYNLSPGIYMLRLTASGNTSISATHKVQLLQ